ncbi:hypothetical protein [Nocardiopsis suaedae]|uniref:Sensor domain-containing protein n=1 Tax=Nocardiopsis suaedae TaxID=3018444 RepID=A0ABT4TIC5_9ACTN|nr:hypothetical protein [Nocardiopsis suaedae]MDA2804019.1 hypothetical protein [Nocardiopsis suaedae]
MRGFGAVLALLAAVGCAAGSGAAGEDGPVPVAPEVYALHVPFDEYRLSVVDHQEVAYARDLLMRSCMRDLGREWEVLEPPVRDPAPTDRRRYGLIEPQVAARYGYHMPPPAPETRERLRVHEEREELSPGDERAAFGGGGEDGGGGCQERAEDRLREDVPPPAESRVFDYESEAFEASMEDPAVERVFGAWSACMRDGGFDYSDPMEVLGDPAWARSERPTDHEIAVAEADVRCKRSTRLVEVWSGVESRIQLEAVHAEPDVFEGFAQAKSAELEAARDVIAEYG